jgi:hypothetical protein
VIEELQMDLDICMVLDPILFAGSIKKEKLIG